MRYADSIAFGRRLCEVFGLDPAYTDEIRLDVKAGAIARVWVQSRVTEAEANALLALLTAYALVEQETRAEPTTETRYAGLDGYEHTVRAPRQTTEGQ